MHEFNLRTLSQWSDMHFVWVAFFELGDTAMMRVGHCARPYRMVRQVVEAAPLELRQAMLAHVGVQAIGQRFEHAIRRRLPEYRTHNSWYMYPPHHREHIAKVLAVTYLDVMDKPPKWTHIDMAQCLTPVAHHR